MPRLALRPLTLIAILALMAVVVGAQAPVPTNEDQETAKTVVDLLERQHMARPVIDDEIAVKWCNNFLKDLDPQKFYFLKADIAEFQKEATNARRPDPRRQHRLRAAGFRAVPSAERRAVPDGAGTAQAEVRLHDR